MANSAGPDQMPHSAASDLGLRCLLKPVCPNTLGYYGISVFIGFDWAEILRPSQPIRVMSSWSVYLTTLFPGQVWSSKQLTCICEHSFARNWQLPFLDQQKGENDHRKYFMINLHERLFQWFSSLLVIKLKNKITIFTFSVERDVTERPVIQWTLVTTTAFIPKDIAFKMNLLL